MARDERTLQMMENFMDLHKAGFSKKEIADKFDLSTFTVYNCLQDIADKYGVSRESLLDRPHSEHLCYERQFEPVEPVDLTDFHKHFKTAMDEIDAARTAIDREIIKQEAFANEMEERTKEWILDK